MPLRNAHLQYYSVLLASWSTCLPPWPPGTSRPSQSLAVKMLCHKNAHVTT